MISLKINIVIGFFCISVASLQFAFFQFAETKEDMLLGVFFVIINVVAGGWNVAEAVEKAISTLQDKQDVRIK